MATKKTSKKETYSVSGNQAWEKFKQLVRDGNVRRIIVKNKSGEILVQFSLTLGVAAGVLAPVLAAAGLIAALVTECTITVEKK